METTAEKMKKIREKMLYNRQEFANLIGVTAGSVSFYENGLRQPSYPTMRRIVELAKKHHFKVSLDDIRE